MGYCDVCDIEISGPVCPNCDRDAKPMPDERYDNEGMANWLNTSDQWSNDRETVDNFWPEPELDEISWPHEEWETEAGLGLLAEAEDTEMEETDSMLELQALAAAEAEAEEYDSSQWEIPE